MNQLSNQEKDDQFFNFLEENGKNVIPLKKYFDNDQDLQLIILPTTYDNKQLVPYRNKYCKTAKCVYDKDQILKIFHEGNSNINYNFLCNICNNFIDIKWFYPDNDLRRIIQNAFMVIYQMQKQYKDEDIICKNVEVNRQGEVRPIILRNNKEMKNAFIKNKKAYYLEANQVMPPLKEFSIEELNLLYRTYIINEPELEKLRFIRILPHETRPYKQLRDPSIYFKLKDFESLADSDDQYFKHRNVYQLSKNIMRGFSMYIQNQCYSTYIGKRKFYINLCDVYDQDSISAENKFMFSFCDKDEFISHEALTYYFDDHILIYRYKKVYFISFTTLSDNISHIFDFDSNVSKNIVNSALILKEFYSKYYFIKLKVGKIKILPKEGHYRTDTLRDDCSDLICLTLYQYIQGISLNDIAIQEPDRPNFLRSLCWIFLKIYKNQPFQYEVNFNDVPEYVIPKYQEKEPQKQEKIANKIAMGKAQNWVEDNEDDNIQQDIKQNKKAFSDEQPEYQRNLPQQINQQKVVQNKVGDTKQRYQNNDNILNTDNQLNASRLIKSQQLITNKEANLKLPKINQLKDGQFINQKESQQEEKQRQKGRQRSSLIFQKSVYYNSKLQDSVEQQNKQQDQWNFDTKKKDKGVVNKQDQQYSLDKQEKFVISKDVMTRKEVQDLIGKMKDDMQIKMKVELEKQMLQLKRAELDKARNQELDEVKRDQFEQYFQYLLQFYYEHDKEQYHQLIQEYNNRVNKLAVSNLFSPEFAAKNLPRDALFQVYDKNMHINPRNNQKQLKDAKFASIGGNNQQFLDAWNMQNKDYHDSDPYDYFPIKDPKEGQFLEEGLNGYAITYEEREKLKKFPHMKGTEALGVENIFCNFGQIKPRQIEKPTGEYNPYIKSYPYKDKILH